MIKTGIIYETLGSVNNMKIVESSNPNEVRLSGVFGVCGVRNDNHRIYEKANYGKCLEALQTKIAGNQALGELEHPNSMNINLENVSHMIESIKMNEDGTVTGTVKLLNTPKGQIAKAIVEGGAPLFISSRAAGSVDGKGNVTLQSIATYDLVGTPGFSQAKLTAENKTFECLNESLENPCWMIVESETPEDGDEETSNEEKKDEKKKCHKCNKEKCECDKEECECEKKEEVKEAGDVESATIKESDEHADEETSKDEPKADEDKSKEEDSKENNSKEDEPKKEEENNENNDNKVNMEDLKKSIDALAEKVSSLEAQLHVAQESLETTQAELNEAKEIIAANEIDYDVIQEWLTSEFAPELATQLNESIADGVQNWVVNEFGAKLETWITEEFAGTVQNWITEEYSAELQKWINEEYSAELQNWICEHFASEVENWVCEEFGSAMQDYITEEVMPEYENLITEKLSSNVSEYLASEKANNKADKMSNVDAMLEKLAAKASKINESKETAKEVIAESSNSKFKGVFVVESMPAQYRPMFEALSNDKQEEIVRSARMYDFTKPNALESFWAGQNFNVNQIIIESKDDNMNHSAFAGVANMMKKLSGRI